MQTIGVHQKHRLAKHRRALSRSRDHEYGPFGELLRATGLIAKSNPFRFSTKYQDDETDLLCYGYRYYNTGIGRWLSRDPIEEDGGANLYNFLASDSINSFDRLGLCNFCRCVKLKTPPKKFKPTTDDFGRVLRTGKDLLNQTHTTAAFGFKNPVEWEIEDGSNVELCKFHVEEKPNHKYFRRLPDGEWHEAPPTDEDYTLNPFPDTPNIPLIGNGKYEVRVNINATYTCTGSDGSVKTEKRHIKFKYFFTSTYPNISDLKID